MRYLTQHHTNTANEKLVIAVCDDPGAGGASHLYQITGYDPRTNPVGDGSTMFLNVLFQNGPIQEAGVNGITIEALLAICADRLRCFEAGPYAHKANARALACLEEGLTHLHSRTLERQARGVEGTHGL